MSKATQTFLMVFNTLLASITIYTLSSVPIYKPIRIHIGGIILLCNMLFYFFKLVGVEGKG